MSATKTGKKSDGVSTSQVATNAKALIMKVTGQKPLEPTFSTMAHVDSGSLIINALIGGTRATDGKGFTCPGYPRRKITEIFGPESSGKCLTADTYLSTPYGLLTVAEVFQVAGYEATCASRTVEAPHIHLYNRYGEAEEVAALTWNNRRPVFEVRLADGTRIKSTANHPHLVLENGFHVWRKTQDIRPGTYVVAPTQVNCFGHQTVESDEAYLYGVLVADGHLGEDRVSVTNDDPEVLRVLREKGSSLLGVEAKEYQSNNSRDLHFNSVEGVSRLYGKTGLKPCLAATKTFSRFMRGFDRDSAGHLLAGYFDCEASYSDGTFEVSSASENLLTQVRLLLRGFGVYSTVAPKAVKAYPDTPYWRLTVTGGDVVSLRENLPLRRDFGLQGAGEPRITRTIPGVQHLVQAFYAGSETTRQHNRLAGDLLSGASQNAGALLRMLDGTTWSGSDAFLAEHLRRLANYEYIEVRQVDPAGEEPTFDFMLPKTHSFVAEGIVTHNTTIALSAAVQVQKQGGTVMFLDFEHAIHHGYAKSIGVKYDDSFMVFAPDTLEEGLKMLYVGIHTGVDLIIVDSVAAMVPQDELEKKLDETAKIGAMAKKMAETLPKVVGWLATHPKIGTGESKKFDPSRPGTAVILLNQERATISVVHGEPTNTAGGKAIKYYAALRLRFSRTGSEVIEKKDPMTGRPKKYPYGNKTKVKVVKNKLDGTQGQDGEFFIRYGQGLDNYYSIIETGSVLGVMKKEGAGYYSFGEHRIQGRDKFRVFLTENPKVYEDICSKVTTAIASSATTIPDEDIEEDDVMAEYAADMGVSASSEVSDEVVEASDASDAE